MRGGRIREKYFSLRPAARNHLKELYKDIKKNCAIKSGDVIKLDVNNRSLELLVEPSEIRKRLKNHATKKTTNESGYTQLYKKHVLQAPQGCDFDFLRPAIK